MVYVYQQVQRGERLNANTGPVRAQLRSQPAEISLEAVINNSRIGKWLNIIENYLLLCEICQQRKEFGWLLLYPANL